MRGRNLTQDEAMENDITIYDIVERGAGLRIRRKFGSVRGMPGGLNLTDMCTDSRRVAILKAGGKIEVAIKPEIRP